MLTNSRHQFPLDYAPGTTGAQTQGADMAPLGMTYAVPTATPIDVDTAEVTYDATRQVSVIATEEGGTILAMGRHTSTQTSTSTASSDRNGNDRDTDSSGD
ncbi:MAG: putative ATP-grasp-modified RiPP [Actinoallomurus sp.]